MKTIVCGPPHSGKSVLINNLQRLMPTEDYLCIRANGDGEGYWTNNPNQQEVDVVRKRNKSGNSSADFEVWRQRIIAAPQSIVIVDIGGLLRDDKAPLFEAADSFIVISSDADLKQQWIGFGESHGCRCIAAIDSILEDDDTIISEKPYFTARLGGLIRGKNLTDKKVIHELAEILVRESGYKNISYVDFNRIGEQLQCANTWTASNGVKVSNVFFQLTKAKELYHHLKDNYPIGFHYRLLGAEANWVAAIAAETLTDSNPNDVSFYDRWTGRYITPCRLSKVENPQNEDIRIEATEDKDTVKLDFTMSALDIDNNEFRSYKLPKIDESKTLLVSGRFPNWFTVSVLMSYGNKEKYFRIPGLTSSHSENYVCVATSDINNLGQLFKS